MNKIFKILSEFSRSDFRKTIGRFGGFETKFNDIALLEDSPLIFCERHKKLGNTLLN